MRIAVIAPYSVGPVRGNIITVKRIARGLNESGADVTVFPMDTMGHAEIEAQVTALAPHIVHAFHAGICGELACTIAEQFNVPCVITITGSDINEEKFRGSPGMGRAMAQAAAVVCFDDLIAADVIRFFPHTAARTAVIHQGAEPLPLIPLAWPKISADSFLVLLPAALRPVKNILFPLRALPPLVQQLPNLRFAIAGGALDPLYAATVQAETATASYAEWLGEVPYENMGSLYARADVVLNCSLHEGMPNSLLEAMAMGRAVLAADIPGNRALVRQNETGWLYRTEEEFRDIITLLAGNTTLRNDMGRSAQEYVRSHFSPRLETKQYLDLFRKLMETPAA